MKNTHKKLKPIALRTVELSQPLAPIADAAEYTSVRVFAQWQGEFLGSVDIAHQGQPISVTRLRQMIVDNLTLKLIEPGKRLNNNYTWASTLAALTERFMPMQDGVPISVKPEPLPAHLAVSVVVATHDRPDDLRNCLRSLTAQVSPRRVEIIVVDNNPDSGLTAAVAADFPSVVLVSERRKGLSYARNLGFTTSTGDIAIATDDDVTMPPDWLEKLVAPFARNDVMIVTGNVLPFELETRSQHLFELYGGLGRGFERFEVNGDWFEGFKRKAVPTWNLGATASAAFRTSIFSHPEIGLLDEALGAGTPTGCSEDTDLFYKVLKAGYTIVYEPDAYVWHKHRRDMAALRRQIYNYSKGHVAYHLITLMRDRDMRALTRLLVELPRSYRWRINERLRGRSKYPIALILLEIKGNLAGPRALWQSRRRARQLGRCAPYVPVAQRVLAAQHPAASVVSHPVLDTDAVSLDGRGIPE